MTTERLTELRAMKDILSDSIRDAEPDKRAPLVNQWRALERDIAELSADSEQAGDPIDEIAQRRAARGAGTASRSVRTERSS